MNPVFDSLWFNIAISCAAAVVLLIGIKIAYKVVKQLKMGEK